MLTAGGGAVLDGLGVAYADDDGTDALVVLIVLAVGALVHLVGETAAVKVGKLGLDALANLEDGEVVGHLEHRAGDELADALGELLVDGLTGSHAHDGVDLGLGMLGSSAARVGGSDVDLLPLLVVALFIHGVVDGLETVDPNLAGLAVDGDLCAPVEVQKVGVALGEGLLKTVEQVQLIDVLLLGKRDEGFHHFRGHGAFPFKQRCLFVPIV